jgi:hypothetical protein
MHALPLHALETISSVVYCRYIEHHSIEKFRNVYAGMHLTIQHPFPTFCPSLLYFQLCMSCEQRNASSPAQIPSLSLNQGLFRGFVDRQNEKGLG